MMPRRVLRRLRSGAVVFLVLSSFLVVVSDAAAIRPTTDLPAVSEQASNRINDTRARYAERSIAYLGRRTPMTEQTPEQQQIPYPEQVRLLRRIMDAAISGGYTVVLDGDGSNRAWLRLSSPDRPKQTTTIEVARQGERVVARWVHAKGRTTIAEARRTDLIVADADRCLGVPGATGQARAQGRRPQ